MKRYGFLLKLIVGLVALQVTLLLLNSREAKAPQATPPTSQTSSPGPSKVIAKTKPTTQKSTSAVPASATSDEDREIYRVASMLTVIHTGSEVESPQVTYQFSVLLGRIQSNAKKKIPYELIADQLVFAWKKVYKMDPITLLKFTELIEHTISMPETKGSLDVAEVCALLLVTMKNSRRSQ